MIIILSAVGSSNMISFGFAVSTDAIVNLFFVHNLTPELANFEMDTNHKFLTLPPL